MKSYRIVVHGIEHSSYFQGHGVAFTRYTHCATGIGHTCRQALDDALDQFATSGDFLESELDEIAGCEDAAACYAEKQTPPEDSEDTYWYVSVDIEA